MFAVYSLQESKYLFLKKYMAIQHSLYKHMKTEMSRDKHTSKYNNQT